MKEIKLEITVEVPDDYIKEEPLWTIEEIVNPYNNDVEYIDGKFID